MIHISITYVCKQNCCIIHFDSILLYSFKSVIIFDNVVFSCRLCHSPPTPQDQHQKDDKATVTAKPQQQQHVSQKTEIATKVRRYGLSRYLHYVQGFEKTLDNKFPSAMHVYRVFIVGIKEFYKDIKHFVRVARIANSQGFKTLARKDIELYYQMPKDMIRVAPVLLISALPFANYVIFPLA